ncbi:MAG: glycosyltransferase [Oscillospiraceae bacterium]|nr:glycosyltransferase [Oscillospiraceae bacterium]
MDISVLLLAYNEAENLRNLLPRIISAMTDVSAEYEIIIVDTQTPTDDTEGVCLEHGAKYVRQDAPGYAEAFKTGIRQAKYGYILNLDADGSHMPEVIPAICAMAGSGYDLVIGSRYTSGGSTDDVRSSIIMSKLLNFVMRKAIGTKARDVSGSFRLYEAAQLKAVTLTRRNYDVLQEVMLRMKLNNKQLKVGEVPIDFQKRLAGKSKRKLLRFILGYLVTVLALLKLRVTGKR